MDTTQELSKIVRSAINAEKSSDRADSMDFIVGVTVAKLEALLSQHSKKRELEIRKDEANIALMTCAEDPDSNGVIANHIQDRINQLGGQDE